MARIDSLEARGRECLDKVLFWNETDLQRKLDAYQKYYNESRVHYSLGGMPPNQYTGKVIPMKINPKNYQWKSCCNGLYRIPMAA
ncbi:MAG: transposase [Oligoflexales bacterium]|nr:transposase [Oligoflexales bacterium]